MQIKSKKSANKLLLAPLFAAFMGYANEVSVEGFCKKKGEKCQILKIGNFWRAEKRMSFCGASPKLLPKECGEGREEKILKKRRFDHESHEWYDKLTINGTNSGKGIKPTTAALLIGESGCKTGHLRSRNTTLTRNGAPINESATHFLNNLTSHSIANHIISSGGQ